MTNKLSIVLTDVPETLLIPLYTRAQETQRADAMLKDETAVEMVNRNEYDFARIKLQTGIRRAHALGHLG